jgi:hypothetical protein
LEGKPLLAIGSTGINDDLRSPLQIHILWTVDPEFQFVIKTRFSDVPDKTISVRGPIPIGEFFEAVDQFLSEPQWDRVIDPSAGDGVPGARLTTFREALESWFIAELSNIPSNLYSRRVSGTTTLKAGIGPSCLFSMVSGSLTSIQPTDYGRTLASHIVSSPVGGYTPMLAAPAERPEKDKVKSAVTYFFPSIYVGEPPRPNTVRERITRQYIPLQPDRVVNVPTGVGRLVVHRNGYVLLVGKEPVESLGLINALFAVGRLKGLKSRAVPLTEIADAEFDQESDSLSSWWTIWNSPRWTSPASMNWRPQSPHQVPDAVAVDAVALQSVVDAALKLFTNEDACRDALFWLEAATDLDDSQYDQSFALSWVVVERWLRRLWVEHMDDLGISGKRKESLMNPATWDVDHQLEALSFVGKIPLERLDKLRELKTKRNRLFHRGERVDKVTASSSVALAEEIVRSHIAVEQTFVQTTTRG